MKADGVAVLVAAGFRTSPTFLDGLREELEQRIPQAFGLPVRTGIVYPYGDWRRSAVRQLREIGRDLRLRPKHFARSVGGREALAAAQALLPQQGVWPLFAVGHSAGGAALLHAAHMLAAGGAAAATPIGVAQIGTPKVPVPPALRERTAYLYAAHPDGRCKDPVCRLGSWGGRDPGAPWLQARYDSRRFAPAAVLPVPIGGGHADYFRTHLHLQLQSASPPEGLPPTNLEGITSILLHWMPRLLQGIESYDSSLC